MLTFAYLVGGWVQANAYLSKTCMNLLKSKNADFEIQGITGYSMNFWENDNHSVWKIAFFIHLFSDDTYLCLEKNKRVRILEQSANKSVFYKIPGGKCQKNWGEHWVGITKSYVIIRVGQQKSYVCLQGGWVGPKKAKNMLT